MFTLIKLFNVEEIEYKTEMLVTVKDTKLFKVKECNLSKFLIDNGAIPGEIVCLKRYK